MSEQKNSFLYIGENGKADWGMPEGYPYKEQETILDGTFEFADGGGVYRHQIADENFTYADGKSYTVIWDGEAYQCVATTIWDLLILGNLGILGAGDDTGEPFLFADQGIGQKLIGTNSTAATHTITVRREIAYPIASEFLPLDSTPTADSTNLITSGGVKNALDGKMSLDAINVQMPSGLNWYSVTYGNGKFVAVANNSEQAAYSEDGINWTASTMPSSANWCSVTYGNGKFVAIADYTDRSAYSEDGINWFSSAMPSSAGWSSITYGNGKFVTVIYASNQSAYSEDGVNWTLSTMPSSANWYSVTYGNRKFVAVEWGPNEVYSYDGITWKNTIEYLSQNNSNITEDVRSVIGIPSYSTANNGQFLRVSDGIPTWTESLPLLTSPNGTKYKLTVSDDGTLSAVAVS